MRLLICTQVVDVNDPILGFFHRWIEEFAAHTEQIIVICLKEGEHSLPSNVRVLSLGKESGASRIKYIARFFSYIWNERKNYDAVFVHMNQVYVLLGGILWRLLEKRIGLWYAHKSTGRGLRFAELLVQGVFTASKESFRLPSKKVQVMGHGIDTDFFRPDPSTLRASHFLSVGRLMPSKRHDLAIRAAHDAGVELRIAGEGPEREKLEKLERELSASVAFLGGLTQEELRDEYRTTARLVHRSETGSLDKVVLEAAACACPVDSSDPAIAALPLSPEYVRTHHSLANLIPRILYILFA